MIIDWLIEKELTPCTERFFHKKRESNFEGLQFWQKTHHKNYLFLSFKITIKKSQYQGLLSSAFWLKKLKETNSVLLFSCLFFIANKPLYRSSKWRVSQSFFCKIFDLYFHEKGSYSKQKAVTKEVAFFDEWWRWLLIREIFSYDESCKFEFLIQFFVWCDFKKKSILQRLQPSIWVFPLGHRSNFEFFQLSKPRWL